MMDNVPILAGMVALQATCNYFIYEFLIIFRCRHF